VFDTPRYKIYRVLPPHWRVGVSLPSHRTLYGSVGSDLGASIDRSSVRLGAVKQGQLASWLRQLMRADT
jgi:hypothetical protein